MWQTTWRCSARAIGAGLRKEDTELKGKINAAIKAIRDNGKYDEITKKYFNFDIYGELSKPSSLTTRRAGRWRRGTVPDGDDDRRPGRRTTVRIRGGDA